MDKACKKNNYSKPAILYLENGQKFYGDLTSLHQTHVQGELVFNTAMTGYEETLTDPSYAGQILVFTFPIIGNYGVSSNEFWEDDKIHPQAVICQSVYDNTFHPGAKLTFSNWLQNEKVPLMTGVDTRQLTKTIRECGVLSGLISTQKNLINPFEMNIELDLVKSVSSPVVKTLGSGQYQIIVVDCGLKKSIVRALLKYDVRLKIVPFDYDYTNEDYDGLVLSNGPGNPKDCRPTIEILKKALKRCEPIMGICLGLQLLGLATGADTYPLKYGHRGYNHPCMDLMNQHAVLTTQNHGYALNEGTLNKDWFVHFRHLNDQSVAGIHHRYKPFFGVQFHPEAGGGPRDSLYLFDIFFKNILASKAS